MRNNGKKGRRYRWEKYKQTVKKAVGDIELQIGVFVQYLQSQQQEPAKGLQGPSNMPHQSR